MTAYSELLPEHLAAIEAGLGITIHQTTPLAQGSSDSTFLITTSGETSSSFVLTVCETPDVTPYGQPVERSRVRPEIMARVASNIKNVVNNQGKNIPIDTPAPLIWNAGKPNQSLSITLPFPNKNKKEEICYKTVYATPFIPHQKRLLATSEQCHLAGQALAAFSIAQQDVAIDSLPEHEFGISWFKVMRARIDAALASPHDIERMTEYLSQFCESALPDNANADAIGFMEALADALRNICEQWEEKTAHLPQGIIHADFSPDNGLLTPQGHMHIIDYGTAGQGIKALDIGISMVSSWACKRGKINIRNLSSLLEGYGSVRNLSDNEKKALPFLAEVAAVRMASVFTDLALDHGIDFAGASPSDYLKTLPEWRAMNDRSLNRLLERKGAAINR